MRSIEKVVGRGTDLPYQPIHGELVTVEGALGQVLATFAIHEQLDGRVYPLGGRWGLPGHASALCPGALAQVQVALFNLPSLLLRCLPREGPRALAGLLPVDVPLQPYGAPATAVGLVRLVRAACFVTFVEYDVDRASRARQYMSRTPGTPSDDSVLSTTVLRWWR